MKRIALLMVCLLFCTAWLMASPSTSTWNGWISESKCGVKGASADHAQCTKKCVEAGAKPVLVTDKDQKIVPIENPSAVSDHLGQHVEVTGTMTTNGSLHIDKVNESAAK